MLYRQCQPSVLEASSSSASMLSSVKWSLINGYRSKCATSLVLACVRGKTAAQWPGAVRWI